MVLRRNNISQFTDKEMQISRPPLVTIVVVREVGLSAKLQS